MMGSLIKEVTDTPMRGRIDPIEWTFLENYYSGLFADFVLTVFRVSSGFGIADQANQDQIPQFQEPYYP